MATERAFELDGPRARPPLRGTMARYVASHLYQKAMAVLTALARPVFLGPEQFGAWTVLRTIPTYAAHAHLGARSAFRFAVPRLAAQSDDAGVAEVARAAFVASLAGAGVVALALAAVIAGGGLAFDTRFALGCVAVWIVLEALRDYLMALGKAREDFEGVARAR